MSGVSSWSIYPGPVMGEPIDVWARFRRLLLGTIVLAALSLLLFLLPSALDWVELGMLTFGPALLLAISAAVVALMAWREYQRVVSETHT